MNGYKGGVCAVLLIYGMSFLFLSCHFPAKPVAKRRECYQAMCSNVAKALKLPNFQIHGLFHHIIWVGDLNYRFGNLQVKECKNLLIKVNFIFLSNL